MPTALIMLLNSDAVVLLKKGIVLEVEKKYLSLYVGSLKFGVDYKSTS